MNDSQLPYDGQRLWQLVAELCNRNISPEQHQELNEILKSSELARVEYWELMDVHSGLYWALADNDSFDEELTTLLIDMATSVCNDSLDTQSHAISRWRFPGWAIAACLLIGLTLVAISSSVLGGRSGERRAEQESQAQPQVALGYLKALCPDSHWSLGKRDLDDSDEVSPGDTIWLDRGAAELRFSDRTVAKLEAPLILQAVSLGRIRMLQGRITVDVAKGAEGFTVETDSAEVIDLGTTFSVEVADSNTDVVVFQGAVDLRVAEPAHGHEVPAETTTKRFRAGQAVRINGDGTLSRIVKVQQTDFSHDEGGGDELNPCVIANVSDNIDRDDLWSFYEIIPGGMGEDEHCFVDRPYEWNGATSDGMPSYLIGGDYVKTFCNDKITEDLNIEVTLGRTATLYVLFDKRAAPPDWLVRSFEATGDEIGIDETNFDVWKQEPKGPKELEVGPGKGIERRFSIWRKVVTEASTVSLGPNGVPAHVTESLDLNAEVVMYGIVAVPQDDADQPASTN